MPSRRASVNFRALDLNLLRVFDAVMAEGSLTRAASVLALTQPAASHALKRLHEALNETLFVRTAAGLKPTPRAEALWPRVRRSLATLQRALAPEHFDPRADAVNYRVAMADATAALLAPWLVRAIESVQAAANLRVLPLTTRDPRPLLRARHGRSRGRPLPGSDRRAADAGGHAAPRAPVRHPIRLRDATRPPAGAQEADARRVLRGASPAGELLRPAVEPDRPRARRHGAAAGASCSR